MTPCRYFLAYTDNTHSQQTRHTLVVISNWHMENQFVDYMSFCTMTVFQMFDFGRGSAPNPAEKLIQSWTWIGSIHGLDWIGFDWVRWLQTSVFFIYIFSILTTVERWRCNTIMSILADFNRFWLDCEFYQTLRLGSIALWHPLI